MGTLFPLLPSLPSRVKLNKFIESLDVSGFTLDLGCGSSRYREHFPNRIGLDVMNLNVDVIGDASVLPFKESVFDMVLCTELLEHCPNPYEVITEIKRVLKPQGKCILTTRFCYPIHGYPKDYYRFTEFGLKNLFAKWDIIYIEPDLDAFSTIVQVIWYELENLKNRNIIKSFFYYFIKIFCIIYFRYISFLFKNKKSKFTTSGYHIIAVNLK